MARKTTIVRMDETAKRDAGKLFKLTELPASAAERWALRAFLAMARSGVEVPDDIKALGFAGIARLGLQALSGMQFGDAEPLLDEMMACVQVQPDPAQPLVVRQLVESDIEEVATRLHLRLEVFKLHADFSTGAAPLISTSAPPQPTAS